MPAKDRYVAFKVGANGQCEECFDVRMVDKEEQNHLKNESEKAKAEKERKEKQHNKEHETIENGLKHFTMLELVMAKSVYDNFVDRGLIENDDTFQQAWFDFYFNGGELPREKDAPTEYQAILRKLGEM